MKRTPEQLRETRAKRALNAYNRRANAVAPPTLAETLDIAAATVELHTGNGAQSQPAKWPRDDNRDIDFPAVASLIRATLKRVKATRLVIIDNASVLSRTVTFADWARDNKDDPDLVADVGNLSPGEGMMIGGGASPAFTIVRLEMGDV